MPKKQDKPAKSGTPKPTMTAEDSLYAEAMGGRRLRTKNTLAGIGRGNAAADSARAAKKKRGGSR